MTSTDASVLTGTLYWREEVFAPGAISLFAVSSEDHPGRMPEIGKLRGTFEDDLSKQGFVVRQAFLSTEGNYLSLGEKFYYITPEYSERWREFVPQN